LRAIKARLQAKADGAPPAGPAPLEVALAEIDSLKEFIRETYQESISTEDARDFTMDIQEQFGAKIRSWGEKLMTPQEYMEAQEAAQQRADDEREFARLRAKLGK